MKNLTRGRPGRSVAEALNQWESLGVRMRMRSWTAVAAVSSLCALSAGLPRRCRASAAPPVLRPRLLGRPDRRPADRHAGALGHERRHQVRGDGREAGLDGPLRVPVRQLLHLAAARSTASRRRRWTASASTARSRSSAGLAVDPRAAPSAARLPALRRDQPAPMTPTSAAGRPRRRPGATRSSCASTGR